MGVIVGDFSKAKIKKFLDKICIPTSKKYEKAYEHLVKADALRIRDYFEESIGEYLIALSLDENNKEALKGLALSYKHLFDFDNAIEISNKLRMLTPFDKTVYFELGECYMKMDKACCAIKSFVKAIKLDHDYLEAQFNLGVAHEMMQEDDIAIMVYSKIIETRPSYIAAYNNLASLYMRLNRYYEAVKVFKQIIEINPEFARAYLGLGVAYDKLERQGEALRYYNRYLEMKPASGNAEYIRSRVNCIRLDRFSAVNSSHLKLV